MEGLFCAQAGRAQGTCTINCDWRSDICPSRFGDNSRCYNTECVMTCLRDEQCNPEMRCELNPDHDPIGIDDNPDHHSCIPVSRAR